MLVMFRIDSQKLEKELKSRGLTNSDVARRIYRNPNIITNAIKRGRISSVVADALEKELNIKKDTYFIDYKKEEKEDDGSMDLYTTIYTAVYAAVRKALTEYEETK